MKHQKQQISHKCDITFVIHFLHFYQTIYAELKRRPGGWISMLGDRCVKSWKASTTSSVAARFDRHGMPPPVCYPDLWPFDLETGVRVASKVRGTFVLNLGTLGLWVLELFYATDGQTDRRTTKATLIAPFRTVGGIITGLESGRKSILRLFKWRRQGTPDGSGDARVSH